MISPTTDRRRTAAALILVALVLVAAAPSAAAAAAGAAAAAPARAAAAPSSPPSAAARRAAAARAATGLAEPVPTDPAFQVVEAEAQLAPADWTAYATAFPRLFANLKPAIARGKALAALPIPPAPLDPIVGACVPFRPPPPFKTLQEYAGAFAKTDWRAVEKMFRDGKTFKDGLGVRGCSAGAIAGDNLWAQVARLVGRADNFWNGKCIDEDKETGAPVSLTNILMPFQVRNRDWVRQRVAGDKLGVATVSLGTSWLDGQPAWVLDYSKSDFIWGFDFRGIRDEVRAVSPGFGIGVVYALASNATFSSGFNPLNVSNTLIYFALFQTCASDGNYPTRPIDRVFV